jgi:hypothetical protein
MEQQRRDKMESDIYPRAVGLRVGESCVDPEERKLPYDHIPPQTLPLWESLLSWLCIVGTWYTMRSEVGVKMEQNLLLENFAGLVVGFQFHPEVCEAFGTDSPKEL